jgi:drug/metabolite transporter (DMT)-like permease
VITYINPAVAAVLSVLVLRSVRRSWAVGLALVIAGSALARRRRVEPAGRWARGVPE